MTDSTNEVKPIAEFHCKGLLWKQTYTLHNDKITVDTIRHFSGDSHTTYLLTKLTPLPTKGSTRGEGLTWGFFLMFMGFGFIGLQKYIGFSQGDSPPTIIMVMGFSGLIWFLRSVRKWYYVIFSTEAGVNVLTLWSPPKTTDSFNPFVDACITAIRAAGNKDETQI